MLTKLAKVYNFKIFDRVKHGKLFQAMQTLGVHVELIELTQLIKLIKLIKLTKLTKLIKLIKLNYKTH